jgi:signal transduction histidine kinase
MDEMNNTSKISFNKSLFFKFNLILVITLIALTLSILFYYSLVTGHKTLKYMKEKVNILSEVIGEPAGQFIKTEDIKRFEEIIKPLIVLNDIEYLFIYNTRDSLIYHFNNSNNTLALDFEKNNWKIKEIYEQNGMLNIYTSVIGNDNYLYGNLLFGVSIQRIEQGIQVNRGFAIYVIVSLIITFFVIGLYFNQAIAKAIIKIYNATQKIIEGKTKVELRINRHDELGEIAHNLIHVVDNISNYSEEITTRQSALVKALQEAESAKFNLNQEIEFMSNLQMLSNEYRKLSKKSEIFEKLCKDICQNFLYHAVLLFDITDDNLVLCDVYFRGLTFLRDTYLIKYSGYVVPGGNDIYKIFDDHTPFFTHYPPCYDELKRAQISGHFAIVPVLGNARVWGVVAVGFLEHNRQVGPRDVEKLMLFLNTIGLTLDTIEVLEDLESAINQRTKQLEKSNFLLNRSINEKNEFLRAISHDLNAPLRNIAGLIDSIIRKYENNKDNDLFDRLARIRKNIDKELGLINEILELSRVRIRKTLSEKININEIIDSIIEKFQFELSAKGIEVNYPQDFPVIYLEKSTIRQIFQNLIDNAIKYVNPNGKANCINISWQVSGDSYEFIVQDTGIGISDKDIDRIFSIFYRGSNELNVSSGGKGVGLAIVKTILESINGEIWVKSKENLGSSFYFTIPLRYAEPDKTEDV